MPNGELGQHAQFATEECTPDPELILEMGIPNVLIQMLRIWDALFPVVSTKNVLPDQYSIRRKHRDVSGDTGVVYCIDAVPMAWP